MDFALWAGESGINPLILTTACFRTTLLWWSEMAYYNLACMLQYSNSCFFEQYFSNMPWKDSSTAVLQTIFRCLTPWPNSDQRGLPAVLRGQVTLVSTTSSSLPFPGQSHHEHMHGTFPQSSTGGHCTHDASSTAKSLQASPHPAGS